MMTRVLAGLAGLFLAAQAVVATPEPEEQYQAALKVLQAKCTDMCGFGIADKPAEIAALENLWDASQAWTIAYLESHGQLTESQLDAGFAKRHPKNRLDVAPDFVAAIAPGLFAFATQWGETGNVFLASRQSGHWRVVWDIRKADPGKFGLVKAWRTKSAVAPCSQTTEACGPVYGRAYALSPDAQGRPRFVINGTRAQMMGFTVGKQISIWRWDGDRATALFAGDFAQTL